MGSITISTGRDLAPLGSPDPVWTLTAAPATVPTGGAAVEIVPPYPGWGTLAASQWATARLSCGSSPVDCPAGDYAYTYCWTSCGNHNAGSFEVLADNSAIVRLNGTIVGSATTFLQGAQSQITLSDSSPFVVGGQNCLVITVSNGSGPSGLNVSGTVSWSP
jgi:hypothetical protein